MAPTFWILVPSLLELVPRLLELVPRLSKLVPRLSKLVPSLFNLVPSLFQQSRNFWGSALSEITKKSISQMLKSLKNESWHNKTHDLLIQKKPVRRTVRAVGLTGWIIFVCHALTCQGALPNRAIRWCLFCSRGWTACWPCRRSGRFRWRSWSAWHGSRAQDHWWNLLYHRPCSRRLQTTSQDEQRL